MFKICKKNEKKMLCMHYMQTMAQRYEICTRDLHTSGNIQLGETRPLG